MIDPEIDAHLSHHEKLAPLVERHALKPRPDHGGDVYFGLLRSITYQQLSGRAASTIFGRFLDLFPDGYPHPERLLDLREADLRAVGMSRSKASYLHGVAEFWLDRKLIDQDWSVLDDDEIIALLTEIRGVGQWTAEMVLMFVLKRPDLLPLDDLVVRRNLIALFDLHHLRGKALVTAMLAAAEPWRPYRKLRQPVLVGDGGEGKRSDGYSRRTGYPRPAFGSVDGVSGPSILLKCRNFAA